MTARELEALCRSAFELRAPVSMDDLAEIKSVIDQRKVAGVFCDVILRGDRVEVSLGVGKARATAWINVRPA